MFNRYLINASATILSVQTSATGTAYVPFGNNPCNALDISNNSGVDIEYQREGAGNSLTIFNGTEKRIIGISNASQVAIKRVDDNIAQVTVQAEAIKVSL